MRTIAHWLHEHDPDRLVAVDVWGDHPRLHAGALYSEADAVAETDYTGWYDSPRDSPAQLTARSGSGSRGWPRRSPARCS